VAVTTLDDGNFGPELGGSERAIVDFFAGWCGPCIMFKPKFKRISNDYPHVKFFMLDGEQAPNARKTVKIDNLPYFGVYKDGQFVEGISTSDEAVFRDFVERHFGKAP
jgi:thioredoxin 1